MPYSSDAYSFSSHQAKQKLAMDSHSLLLFLLVLLVDVARPTPLMGPRFIGDTPPDGSCFSVPYGSKWNLHAVVQSDSQ